MLHPLSPRNSSRWLLVSLVAVASAVSCVDEDADAVRSRGTIVFNHFEGGFYGITGDDGRKWDPENLSDEFAVDGLQVSFQAVVTDKPTFHMWGQTVHLTEMQRLDGPPPVDLEPFRELARNASCADLFNRLFLIDGRLVFWDQRSQCSDASFTHSLYGRTVSHLMCRFEDSIAGPRRSCNDRATYAAIFDTIIENLDKPDLGLGAGHTVETIDF